MPCGLEKKKIAFQGESSDVDLTKTREDKARVWQIPG